ncbi:MAG: response regulator [Desulfobacteraceae bacterium]|jgi:DNA-binding response OmpR family regulator|nr:MAG: response regulator [Desulfobacteraceae bacterium]
MPQRIIIIDDEPQIRAMLKQFLEIEGYEVLDAADGKEGLRLNEKKPADLVITDLIMPEKEGIETIKELKTSFPAIKIIAMSGGGRVGPETYLGLAKKLGAEKTLAKPFELRALGDAVRELLAG